MKFCGLKKKFLRIFLVIGILVPLISCLGIYTPNPYPTVPGLTVFWIDLELNGNESSSLTPSNNENDTGENEAYNLGTTDPSDPPPLESKYAMLPTSNNPDCRFVYRGTSEVLENYSKDMTTIYLNHMESPESQTIRWECLEDGQWIAQDFDPLWTVPNYKPEIIPSELVFHSVTDGDSETGIYIFPNPEIMNPLFNIFETHLLFQDSQGKLGFSPFVPGEGYHLTEEVEGFDIEQWSFRILYSVEGDLDVYFINLTGNND